MWTMKQTLRSYSIIYWLVFPLIQFPLFLQCHSRYYFTQELWLKKYERKLNVGQRDRRLLANVLFINSFLGTNVWAFMAGAQEPSEQHK